MFTLCSLIYEFFIVFLKQITSKLTMSLTEATEQLGQGPFFIKCANSDLYGSIPRFELDQDMIVFGRNWDSDVHIDEGDVSKSHAILLKVSSVWYLVDFNSRNGVFVNHQKLIPKSPYQLVVGDVFSLGPTEFLSFVFGSYDDNNEDKENVVKSINLSSEAKEILPTHFSQIGKMQDKIDQLEKELALREKSEDEVGSLKTDFEKLKDELQSQSDVLKNLRSQAAEDKAKITKLQKAFGQLVESHEAKVKIEVKLNQRISELDQRNEERNRELRKQTLKIKDLEDMNYLNQETIAKLRIENGKHQKAVEDGKGEIAKLKTRIEQLKGACEISDEALRKSALAIDQKRASFDLLQKQFTEVMSQNTEISAEIDKANLKSDNLIRENKALIAKNKSFVAQISQLNQKVSQLSKVKHSGTDRGLQDMQDHVALIMENELNCSICSDFFVDAVTLGCSHVFCNVCITSWKKKKADCPTCRKPIATEAFSPVIDNFINKMVCYLPNDIKVQRDKVIEERCPKIPAAQQRQNPSRQPPQQANVRSQPPQQQGRYQMQQQQGQQSNALGRFQPQQPNRRRSQQPDAWQQVPSRNHATDSRVQPPRFRDNGYDRIQSQSQNYASYTLPTTRSNRYDLDDFGY